MAAKREQVIWAHLWSLCCELEESYSLTAILSAGLLAFSRMNGDERETAIKAARRYQEAKGRLVEVEDISLDIAFERVRLAATQYQLLSPDRQKWLDDFRTEAIAAQQSILAADQVVAGAVRDTKDEKQKRRQRGSTKHA